MLHDHRFSDIEDDILEDSEPRGFVGQCHFVHKRIGGVLRRIAAPAVSFLPIPGAGILSQALAGQQRQRATELKFAPQVGPTAEFCRANPNAHRCVAIAGTSPIQRLQQFLPGGATGMVGVPRDQFGAAVLGRYGAALEPAMIPTTRLRCPHGSVLGDDNLCYDHIPNHHRKWPAGRRPLMTGGDLNAISKASRAAARLKVQTKRLQKLGMLKSPSRPRK